MLGTNSNEERNLPLHHNSWLGMKYQSVRTFETHVVDCCNRHTDEDKPHNVEVERTPMVFKDHVRVSGQKHH